MSKKLVLRTFRPLVVLAPCLPDLAFAHAFVQPYSLPVPFSMYAYGSAAVLVVSFIMIGLFSTAPPLRTLTTRAPTDDQERGARGHAGVRLGRCISTALLLLSIATGLVGTQNAFANANMTLFWILFVLGVPYLTFLAGNFFAAVNPWRVLADVTQRVLHLSFSGCSRHRLTYLPAVVLYMGFIWIELFGHLGPRGLSVALLAYTMINLGGAWVYGIDEWFEKGEFFGLNFRLISGMSPLARARRPVATWGPPLPSALGRSDRRDVGLAIFVLFMLSSTAYDGLHETLPWVSVFWKNIYPHIADTMPVTSGNKYAISNQIYYVWQWCSLLLSPFIYLGAFTFFLFLAKTVTCTSNSVPELVVSFAPSLLPIALVYHVTHYYTLLLMQGGQIVRLISDPFGFGWNLFGTARLAVNPIVVSANSIWHTQVALILAGHVMSVYLGHVQALRTFRSQRAAVLSQVPLLFLMVIFTVFGLWILSLPLAMAGQR